MGQISHPTMGSPHAMVTSYGELVVVGSRGIDKSTNATTIIDYAHHTIHNGEHFNVRGFKTLVNSGDSLCFSLTTPNSKKWTHMLFEIEGTNQTEIYEWEGPTLSGGTLIIPINNNRNSTITSANIIKLDPVISGASPTSGILLANHSKGLAGTTPAKASSAGETEREDELILKSGTTYMWCIKTAGDDNIIDYAGTWYEHTDKIQQF